jgi:hemin uptake protein HemP
LPAFGFLLSGLTGHIDRPAGIQNLFYALTLTTILVLATFIVRFASDRRPLRRSRLGRRAMNKRQPAFACTDGLGAVRAEPDRTFHPSQTPRVPSEALLGERGELIILHAGREYRLRRTSLGKLMLTA